MKNTKWIAATLLCIFVGFVCIWKVSKLTTFQFLGEIYSRIPTDRKVIALTFDDGPNVKNTPEILNLLDKYQAKATFFMIGKNIQNNPDIAKLVLSKGHQIGNHSYSHKRMVFKAPSWVRNELEVTNQLIRKVGFQGEILFRSPFGKKLFILPYVLSKMGMKNIMWEVESDDTETQDTEILTSRTLPYVHEGSIVLFHDGGEEKPGTITTVEKLLKSCSEQEYNFITVSELLALAN